MAGADATVYVWHLFILCMWPINQTYAVASASTATGSVLIRKFRVFVGTVALSSKDYLWGQAQCGLVQ